LRAGGFAGSNRACQPYYSHDEGFMNSSQPEAISQIWSGAEQIGLYKSRVEAGEAGIFYGA
jgi:hypothetical protein